MIQYGCEQSYVPGQANTPPSPSLVLQLGACVNSPYQFQSFLPNSGAESFDSCDLQVFPEPECSGTAKLLNFAAGDIVSGRCSFQQGNSVSLACNNTMSGMSENAAAQFYLDQLCTDLHSSNYTTSEGIVSSSSLPSLTATPVVTSLNAAPNAVVASNATILQATPAPSTSGGNTTSTSLPASATNSISPYQTHFANGGAMQSSNGPEVALWLVLVYALNAWT